jgi:prevent-host-death family protein
MSTMIGIRELQQNASRFVREAENGTEFEITSQGRPTGVTLAKVKQPRRRGATLEELLASQNRRPQLSDEAAARLLRFVDEGREAAGYVGDPIN